MHRTVWTASSSQWLHLQHWNGRQRMGSGAERKFDCGVFFLFLPWKYIHWKLFIACPPCQWHKKRAYPTSELMWGKGGLCWNGHPPAKGGKKGRGRRHPGFQIVIKKTWWFQKSGSGKVSTSQKGGLRNDLVVMVSFRFYLKTLDVFGVHSGMKT